MENKLLNYSYWIDCLLNSSEHFDDIPEAARHIVLDLEENKDKVEASVLKSVNLLNYWMDNDDSFRTNLQLNYHKDVAAHEESLKQLIDRFLK
jgi:hypothetical protein